jgi:alpha-beta hydrolase superfamily lysophospholipase
MSIYVLVHGAWHGGCCWQRVAPRLHAAGHDVYTPTLTGQGERLHLARPEIDLTTHVMEVVNLIQYEDLTDRRAGARGYIPRRPRVGARR